MNIDKNNPAFFMGSSFVWWQGVVEDTNDPLKLGRCRVRILGFHNPDTNFIPTEHLPWASTMQPVTSAAISEIGQSPRILQGSWVVGFFRDHNTQQQPIIIGTIPGIPLSKNVEIGNGFADPNGIYPKEDHLNESDLSRLARNEKIDETIVATKKQNVEKNVSTALNTSSWDEPETPYDAQYPKNQVTQTESGHIIELDDTENKERVHVYHKSGTFSEIHPDGKIVNKIVGKKYDIIYDDNNVLIKGNKIENINQQALIKIGDDVNLEISGNVTLHIHGDCFMQTDGDLFHKIKGTYNIVSEQNMTFVAPRIDFNPAGRSSGGIGNVV